MFVFAIRCAINDLVLLKKNTAADYYLDYGLLVFPEYSRASCFQNHGSLLTNHFLAQIAPILKAPGTVRQVDLEHPFVSDEQEAAADTLKSKPAWYYVPSLVAPGAEPQLIIS